MFSEILHLHAQCKLRIEALGFSVQGSALIIGIAMLLCNATAYGAATPDDVFIEALILERQIDLLRESSNNTIEIKKPLPQKGKSSVHVFAKSIEVREKIAAVQKLYGLETIDLKGIPSTEIGSADVLESVLALRNALSTILKSQNLIEPIGRSSIVSGMTPNEVYEKLWFISNSLDTFIGPIQPSSVFVSVTHALIEAKNIAQKLDVEVPVPLHIREGALPMDVNIEGFRNLYRIAKLQRELGVSTIPVGAFPIGTILPADVYDTTNIILAELSRIRAKLKMPDPEYGEINGENKSPAAVLIQMQQIGQISNLLIAKVKGS